MALLVVSDTSVLSILSEIQHIGLLRDLFGRIVVAEAMHRECLHPGAPEALRRWIASGPG